MDSLRPLTRRHVLLGGAGVLLLAACGSDGEETDEAATTTTAADGGAGGLMLLKLFPPAQPVGVDLRLPLGVTDSEGSFDVDAPKVVQAHLRSPNGATTPPVSISQHDQGLPRGYYPLRATFDETGRWTIVVETGTSRIETPVDVRSPGEVPSVPGPGDVLPKIPTPTIANHRGVNPICTREPQCPFHDRSLDELIGGSQPIALLVSTPAFCQVAICGPVLDLLVERKGQIEAAGIAVVHAEVYTDNQARRTAPAVDALGLTYEPALFLAAPDGTVTDRLDSIYDRAELDESLAKLAP